MKTSSVLLFVLASAVLLSSCAGAGVAPSTAAPSERAASLCLARAKRLDLDETWLSGVTRYETWERYPRHSDPLLDDVRKTVGGAPFWVVEFSKLGGAFGGMTCFVDGPAERVVYIWLDR